MKSGFCYTNPKRNKQLRKPLNLLFKYNFTTKWPNMAITILVFFPMAFYDFPSGTKDRIHCGWPYCHISWCFLDHQWFMGFKKCKYFLIQPYASKKTHLHGLRLTNWYLENAFYAFWSDDDLHGDKSSGISVFSSRSGLLHFFSYIASKQPLNGH